MKQFDVSEYFASVLYPCSKCQMSSNRLSALLPRALFQSWRHVCLLVCVFAFSNCRWFCSEGGNSLLLTGANAKSAGIQENLQTMLNDITTFMLLNVRESAKKEAEENAPLFDLVKQGEVSQALGLSNLKVPDIKVSGLSFENVISRSWADEFCDKEKTYTITSGEALEKLRDEAECIFARGVAPLRPPIGLWYGYVLKLMNTKDLNFMVERVWAGKVGFKAKCGEHDPEFHLALNFAFNDVKVPAYMYVGHLNRQKVCPQTERCDNKPSLFVDYMLDMDKMCPSVSVKTMNLNKGIINKIIDVVRVVGRTKDGGYIMLGKTLLRDINDGLPDVSDSPVAWWYIINHDHSAYGSIPRTLGKLEKSFEYRNIQLLDPALDFFRLEDLSLSFTSLGNFLPYILSLNRQVTSV